MCSEKLHTDLSEKLFHKKDRTLKEGTIILVNGKNIFHLQLLDTVVDNGDVVSVFPPAGGG
jgi:molybdopterin synthase sulfur carrier subunit